MLKDTLLKTLMLCYVVNVRFSFLDDKQLLHSLFRNLSWDQYAVAVIYYRNSWRDVQTKVTLQSKSCRDIQSKVTLQSKFGRIIDAL